MQSKPLQDLVFCLHPAKMKNAENLVFAEILRCIVDCINHIYMYFLHTTAIETIPRVGVVSPSSKKNNAESDFC